MVLLQPICKQVGQHVIVEVLHQEVRVAAYTELGQLHERGIAAMTIDAIDELAAHLQSHAPVFVTEILAWRFGDVVAEIHHDGYLREPFELFRRHGNALAATRQPVYLCRYFPLGEYIHARLVGGDGNP